MHESGLTYEIETLDVEFTHAGQTTASTVIIRKYRKKKKIRTVRYGLKDKDEIYQDIQAGRPINLDRCYVKNFSLVEYRKIYGKADEEQTFLPAFSAQGTFFDANRSTDFSYAAFDDELTSFKGAIFSQGNINFNKANFHKGDADFSEVSFGGGDVNFQYARFEDGDLNFENAFCEGGEISFVNANFGNGAINFRDMEFGSGNTSFMYAKFGSGEKTFERANFSGQHSDFRMVEFGSGKVDFRRADFGDSYVTFDQSEFGHGRVNFRLAKFGEEEVSFEMVDFGTGGANFERAIFGSGKLNFSNTKFDELILHGTQLNGYVDLRVTDGGLIDLTDTIVRDVIDFQPASSEVKIKTLNIAGMRTLGRIFIDWHRNNVHQLIASQKDTTMLDKAIQFNILKEALHNNGQYTDEDLAYIAFKRFELQAFRKDNMAKSAINALWVYPSVAVQWLVFDKAGLYATNPVRVLVSMILVYTAFSVSFIFLPDMIVGAGIECSGADHTELHHAVKAFYYSAITFTTVGYGDCLPSGMIKILAGIEGWVGVFLMSYFTVAFVRRILR